MSSSTLVLCVQADGPYSTDLIYIPAYPSGFTYEKWQFRYRDKWLHRDALANISKWSECGDSLRLDAVVAARFKTAHLNRILPLRKIQITRAYPEAGVNVFYFRLLALQDFRGFATLEQGCLELLAGEWSADPDANPLVFYTDADGSALKWSLPKDEGASWAQYVDLVARAGSLPVSDSVRSATFVRFSIPSRGLKEAPVELLHTDSARGPVFGAALKEGCDYSIKITHRMPGSGRGDTRPTIEFQYEIPSKNIGLSQPAAEVIGYQQTTPVGIRAVAASGSWEDFIIKASTKVPPSGKAKTAEQTAPVVAEVFTVPIPLKVRANWLYRFRSRWIWNILLFLALTVQGVTGLLRDFLAKFFDGKASLSDLFSYWQLWILIIVSSAAATFAITGIQGRTNTK